MKRVKLIRDGGFRLVVMSMMALFAFTGCSAHPNSANAPVDQPLSETDSVMRAAVGDSIYRIITEAKKVKAEEIVLTTDSVKTTKSAAKDVKGKFIYLVQFVLSSPKNYGSDLASFGNFMPCFKLTFVKKKEICVLNFDFGLKKWSICDASGKVIKKYDLPSDDMLRIAHMLFTENKLYNSLLNTDKR
jgi:hypothetical protein